MSRKFVGGLDLHLREGTSNPMQSMQSMQSMSMSMQSMQSPQMQFELPNGMQMIPTNLLTPGIFQAPTFASPGSPPLPMSMSSITSMTPMNSINSINSINGMYWQPPFNFFQQPSQSQLQQQQLQLQQQQQQQQTQESRTIYIGNLPEDAQASEILSLVHTGIVESLRLLPERRCAFVSFLEPSAAALFHADAVTRRPVLGDQEVKVGWGKPSPLPPGVAAAARNASASRNLFLGSLPEDATEQSLIQELGRFGPIDSLRIVPDRGIAFCHFLSIASAIKAVAQLPLEPRWATTRVYYGRDRCAALDANPSLMAHPVYPVVPIHSINANDLNHMGNNNINNNRTVYLGNIHPETTLEEICNVVRGGILHHIRYIPDKHICFVTFVDPNAAHAFAGLGSMQGLTIHNRRLKIGWGKHSGPLPTAIALAVAAGASRNVYVGNVDDAVTEDSLRRDFSEWGEIELVNTLREKNCAFVNFTNLGNAIKAIEGIKVKEEYRRYRINFGKDRCGNPPRQVQGQGHVPMYAIDPTALAAGQAQGQAIAGSYFPVRDGYLPLHDGYHQEETGDDSGHMNLSASQYIANHVRPPAQHRRTSSLPLSLSELSRITLASSLANLQPTVSPNVNPNANANGILPSSPAEAPVADRPLFGLGLESEVR